MLEALGRRGLDVTGIDRSRRMVETARGRLLGARIAGSVVEADITDFRLDRELDGAVCPINTLLHLAPEELARHLGCMAQHLRVGGRYLAQVALEGDAVPRRPSRWEIERGDVQLRVTWSTESIDLSAGRQVQRSRLEVLRGPRAGEVVEEEHEMIAWTPEAWADVVERSPFEWTASYDGEADGWPAVVRGTPGHLLWHELTRRPR
jgi:hypothetical protein